MSNSTPNRKPASVLKDTPLRNGSGSDFAHTLKRKEFTKQPRCKPYLEVDTHDAIILPFEELLSMAFNVNDAAVHPEIVGTIANSPGFGRLLSKFLHIRGAETALYAPFNQLVKYVFDELRNSDELSTSTSTTITICRNDPTLVRGGPSERKPDCVIVYQKAIDGNPIRTRAYEKNQYGPTSAPFYWSELLTFVEFKVGARSKSAGGRSTSGTPAISRPPSGSQSARSKGSGATSSRHSAPPKTSRKLEVQSLPAGVPGRLTRSQNKRVDDVALSRAMDSQATNPPPASTNVIQGGTSVLSGPSAPLATDVFYDQSVSSQISKGTSSLKRSGDDDIAEPSSKRSRFDPRKTEGVIQSASYALEMMSCGGFRTHAFGILITGNQLEFLCFDRSRTVMSERLNFETDKHLLVALLYYMAKATSAQLGLVSAITPGPKKIADEKKRPLVGMRIKLNDSDNTVLEIIDVIFMQRALVGRGTCVVHAEVVGSNKWKGKKIVVKLSFTPRTRTPEGTILADIVKIANANERDKWVLDHIPEVLHSEVLEPDPNGLHARLAKLFNEKKKEEDKEDEQKDNEEAKEKPFEERILTILVMTEQHLFEELKGPKDLMKAFIDIYKCYRWLYETAEIMHRDVSLNNMMYRLKDGKVYGVLSDYDLVLLLKNRGCDHSSQHRTGTLPFMAIDLLEIPPMLHYYRHDLESMFYCLSIVVIENVASPVRRWYKIDQITLLESKRSFMTAQLPPLTTEFGSLRRILESMRFLFFDGFSARQNVHRSALQIAPQGGNRQPTNLPENSEPGKDSNEELIEESGLGGDTEFDQETLGGHVTFGKFEAVITLAF